MASRVCYIQQPSIKDLHKTHLYLSFGESFKIHASFLMIWHVKAQNVDCKIKTNGGERSKSFKASISLLNKSKQNFLT